MPHRAQPPGDVPLTRVRRKTTTDKTTGYLEDREAHLEGPRAHDFLYRFAARLRQGAPQVLGERVLVLVARQVDVHPLAVILKTTFIKDNPSSHL